MDRQKALRNTVIGGLALSATGLGFVYVKHLVGIDPFASMGKTERQLDDVAIKLRDVDMKQYSKGQLIAEAHIDGVDVKQNRQEFDLSKVTNGVYYAENGKIEFEADAAKWNNSTLQLMVTSGANIKNKDFDLNVSEFTFDKRSSVVNVPGGIKGRLMDGQVAARQFRYNLKDATYRLGPTRWSGTTALNLQEDPPGKKSKWTFETSGVISAKKGIETSHNIKATDGEIIVSGDTAERNQKTDVLTVTGNVLYFSPKANLACDKVTVYRTEKRAILEGHVRMLIKPKDSMEKQMKVDLNNIPTEVAPFRPVVPDDVKVDRPTAPQSEEEKKLDEEVRSGKTTRKYPTVVLGDRVEWWYGKGNRRAVVTGSPQAEQSLAGGRWRRAWAYKALYDGEKEILRLESGGPGKKDARYTSSLGDVLKAIWFAFSTKDDADVQEYDGEDAEGQFAKADDDPTTEEQKPPATPPATKPEKPKTPAG